MINAEIIDTQIDDLRDRLPLMLRQNPRAIAFLQAFSDRAGVIIETAAILGDAEAAMPGSASQTCWSLSDEKPGCARCDAFGAMTFAECIPGRDLCGALTVGNGKSHRPDATAQMQHRS